MKRFKPTDSELEILEILWDQGPSTVKSVNQIQNSKKAVGYTTTLKMMQIMLEKKILTRIKSGRGHVYTTNYNRDETRKIILDNLLNSVFAGSASKLVMQVIDGSKMKKKDIDEIKEFISNYEKVKNGNN